MRYDQPVNVSGRLLDENNGPISQATLLSLQAFVAGRGSTPARTVRPNPRTGPRGRFRVAYRFGRTYQRVVYRFRVVVGEDSAFPFMQTTSRRIGVIVKP